MTQPQHPPRALITSEELSPWAHRGCWVIAIALLAAGAAATFLEKPGAAAAAMIALGGLLTIVALMKRIPLRLEVAGTKLDASYPSPDDAYDAGREGGVVEGLEQALQEAEDTITSGAEVEEVVRRIRDELVNALTSVTSSRLPGRVTAKAQADRPHPAHDLHGMGYAASVACNAAGVSYRQLDYWARTGLVEPGGTRNGDGDHDRVYTWDDVTALAVVKRLLDAGVSLRNIRSIIRALREQHPDWSQVTLVSDGVSIFETTQDSEVIDVLNSAQVVFAVNVGSVRQQVAGMLAALPGIPIG